VPVDDCFRCASAVDVPRERTFTKVQELQEALVRRSAGDLGTRPEAGAASDSRKRSVTADPRPIGGVRDRPARSDVTSMPR
jgi:hypothetical protein